MREGGPGVEDVIPVQEGEGGAVLTMAGPGEGGGVEMMAVVEGEAPEEGCGGTWSRWMTPWGPVMRVFLGEDKLLRVGLGWGEPDADDNSVRKLRPTGQRIFRCLKIRFAFSVVLSNFDQVTSPKTA